MTRVGLPAEEVYQKSSILKRPFSGTYLGSHRRLTKMVAFAFQWKHPDAQPVISIQCR